jgi:hypothetical protein
MGGGVTGSEGERGAQGSLHMQHPIDDDLLGKLVGAEVCVMEAQSRLRLRPLLFFLLTNEINALLLAVLSSAFFCMTAVLNSPTLSSPNVLSCSLNPPITAQQTRHSSGLRHPRPRH